MQVRDVARQLRRQHQRLPEAPHPVARRIAAQVAPPDPSARRGSRVSRDACATRASTRPMSSCRYSGRYVTARLIRRAADARRLRRLAQREQAQRQAAPLQREQFLGDERFREPRIPLRTTAIEPPAREAAARTVGGAGTRTSVSDASFRIGKCYHRSAAIRRRRWPASLFDRAPDPYRMDRSLFRYILRHTWRAQAFLLVLTCISFPLIYINLELPKRIVNNAIQGKNIPATLFGIPVTQVSYLMALSLVLLLLITINGGLKYWINVYSGVVGERTLRRMRHDLYQQVLRFPLPQFKTMSAGEIIPMIVAETEPVGGFIGESSSRRSSRAACCSRTWSSSSTRTCGSVSRRLRCIRRRST
jgi:hypothetical protein